VFADDDAIRNRWRVPGLPRGRERAAPAESPPNPT
jgi:hypothetical protein